ncbi:hypothetical protein IP84_09820 [beta proteobacterium AAP99]|nr:hypothetical protein IP84_09820 [beta proteobacterium AAP99]
MANKFSILSGETFRYHGIWAPGIRLFRQLRFRTKAILIAAALLLPAFILGAAYLSNMYAQVSFSAKEREGVAAMRYFVPVLKGVTHVRNATRAGLGGFDTQADYKRARANVDAALGQFDAHLKRSGDPLKLRARFDAMRTAWANTEKSSNGVDDKGRTVFGPVADAALKVLRAISDESNLVLDPDLDTLYMINALFL